jgi:hypothetical protein
MGMIYKRGKMFLIKYYSDGKPIRKSTGTSKLKQAERMLKDGEAVWRSVRLRYPDWSATMLRVIGNSEMCKSNSSRSGSPLPFLQ